MEHPANAFVKPTSVTSVTLDPFFGEGETVSATLVNHAFGWLML